MQSKVLLFVTIVAFITLCSAAPVDNGKYQVSPYNQLEAGKYRASEVGKYSASAVGKYSASDVGKYSASEIGKYSASEVGKYSPEFNIGGRFPPKDTIGKYKHTVEPYVHHHDNRELGKYVHIPNPYDGGFGPYNGTVLPYIHDDNPYEHIEPPPPTTTTTTTMRPTTTTTTTTTTQRSILFNYDDEGRHKILHQEERRKHDQYDHAYLTENGIYGEERAKLHENGGTHAIGYYEYTGDDGHLYRINYKSDHNGFMPEGDHIPTSPPIPEAIARALKFVDDKRKANGEMPMFDHRGFQIDNMSKEMWDVIKKAQAELAKQDKEMQADQPEPEPEQTTIVSTIQPFEASVPEPEPAQEQEPEPVEEQEQKPAEEDSAMESNDDEMETITLS